MRWVSLGLVLLGLWSCSRAAVALDLEARLDWDRRVELGVLATGIVAEVSVIPGQRVQRGELLVELDQRRFRARVQEAEAARAEAAQQQAEAQRELERALELYDRAVLADHDLKLAEIGAAEAQAAAQRAEAALTNARLELEYSQVRAPFPGVVTAVRTAPGEAVVSRLQVRPLVVVADDGRWRAKALVGAEHATLLQVGRLVQVAVAGEWFEGEVLLLGLEPAGEAAEGPQYELQVVFPAPATSLRAGRKVMVRVDE